ncbi:hypothetical protein CHS0354_030578 [Potamilus streckersoni]|uniref:SRCR domain-containing protein n=1 Tax=Potamilus streckersoni TaxID=2493646 RepID=A0AAE0VUB6_9BIVA|nr:hypothetical protein CHS0354_030578 [Potamilus streckersoni]
MCFLFFLVFLALCSQTLHAMPPISDTEENMVNLLSEKIRHMERSMDIEMRMLKNEVRREIRGSCSKCVRSIGNTNISSLQFEVRTLHSDVKQLAASVERLSSLVMHYVENATSPLMQKITSLVNASMDNSEQIRRIQENLMSVSKRLEGALRPTEPPVSATTAMEQKNVRLVNGSSPMSGRVEVYHDGEWGTICDDGWDDTDASVVCRMLGYSYGRHVRDAMFGPGSGRIWLDDVNCQNDSRDLADCQHSGWGTENCNHIEDAGVECLDFFPPTTPLSNTTNEQVHVRLVGGNTERDGRVEVYYTGREDLGWGTVCDDDWDDRDAAVVCRMLGFSGGGTSPKGKYGMGVGSIILDDLHCQGFERTLAECGNFNPGYDNCGHEEDAGVICGPELSSTESPQIFNRLQVRLVGGQTESDGRVEVYYTGREDLGWGTVCDDDWDDRDAAVVCRMLGFSGGRTTPKGVYGTGEGSILLDDLKCQGTEKSLVECINFKPGDNNCIHEEDAGVICEPLLMSTNATIPPTSAIQIRLVNGPSPSEGRIEIFKDGMWGTVCDDGWDNNDAKVICRMLNYLGGTAYSQSKYGHGIGDILLDNVECSGLEQSITDCRFPGWNQHDCDHQHDAGVFCNQLDGIRLVNGSAPNEGRVEIQVNGKYGTICDDKFDDKAATVVCRMLGYNMGGVANGEAKFGEGSGPIHLDNLECSGNEQSLVNCQYLQPGVVNCEHDEDVGVTCFTGENVTQTNGANNVSTGSLNLTESNMTSFYKSVCQETLKFQGESLSESDRYWMKIWCEEYRQNLENSTAVENSSAFSNANTEGEGSNLTTVNHVTQTAGDNGLDKESSLSVNILPVHSPASHSDSKDVTGQPEADLTAFQCNASQFHCFLSGVCIEATNVCDNEIDCPDVEDELDCDISCSSREFKCTNRMCITAAWACDGEVDCSDGSDEVNCDTADVSCENPSTFRCSDGKCIHATLVCDGDTDCEDKTDEVSCDMIGNDGSFVFAAWDKIVVVSVRGEAFVAEHIPLKGIDSTVFLDVDRLSNTVYWSSPNYIHKANLNGSDQDTLLKTGVKNISEGLAVNQVDKTIYWTNKMNQSISMTNLLDMTTVTIASNITEPIDVYFDRKARQVYWTEGKTLPKISRADLDGSNRITVVDTDVMWPHSLAIDHLNSRLYWTDIMKQTVEMIFLNGTGRRVLVGKLGRPLGITLIGKYVYWSDRLLQHVARINKETGLEKRVIYLPQHYQYFSIKTLSQIIVPEKIPKS